MSTPRSLSRAALVLAVAALGACGKEPMHDDEGIARYGVPKDEGARPGAAVALGEAKVETPAPTPTPGAGGPGPAPEPPKPPPRPRAGAYVAGPVTDGGTIKGRIVFTARPKVPMVPISKDKEACKHDEHASERIVFDEATLGVGNCVVSIRNIAKGKDWSGDMAKKDRVVDIDQRQCVYVPHVRVVRAKTQLAVRNSDPAEHNIHGYRNTALQNQFNLMSSSGSYIDRSDEAFLEKAAKYIVKCDIHPWMNAFVFAVDHPYHVVTAKDGTFELTDVPAGTWEVGCWHEGMGLTPLMKDGAISGYDYGEDIELPPKTVTVTAGGTATVAFELTPP
jgi:hypothetical protein